VRLPHAAAKSREIDSMSSAGDSIPRKSRFQIVVRKRRVLPALYKRLPIPRSIGLSSSFAGFLPWLGVR